jgi:hypothetical protein
MAIFGHNGHTVIPGAVIAAVLGLTALGASYTVAPKQTITGPYWLGVVPCGREDRPQPAGRVGDRGDRGRGQADAAVQLDGRLGDALACLVHLLGRAAHPIGTGLQFGRPDWLPELISRYNLTPPPGA